MAPKRAERMVVKTTRKVVEESVQVSVVGSSKRLTRGNKDVGSTLEEEHVRIIPVQEATPQANYASTTTVTNEDNTKQEKTPNDRVQYGTEEQKRDTDMGAQNEEPKKPSVNKEQEKKGKAQEGNDGKERRTKKKRGRRNGEGYQRYVYRVLKQVHPEMGISSQAMTILNNLMNDMFERLADEASKLKMYTGHMTLDTVVKGDSRASETGFTRRPWEACYC